MRSLHILIDRTLVEMTDIARASSKEGSGSGDTREGTVFTPLEDEVFELVAIAAFENEGGRTLPDTCA